MFTFRTAFLAGVSLISVSTPAFAEQASDDSVSSESTIIVEARRKDESLQDVPLTVNAVTSESLQKLNIRDMKDITSVVPGLTLNPGNRTTGSISSLRGLNVDVNSSGNNGTVEFYMNDAALSAGAVLQSMFDIGQIEVLRGPQGTLRGRAAPSGSITVVSKKANMEEWGGQVQGAVTHVSGVNLQAAVNAPIIKGVLALRVAGLVDDNEGSRVTSVNSPSISSSGKTRGVRVSLRATPVDGLELNASYTHLVKNALVWDQVETVNVATGAALPVGASLITAKDKLSVENVPNNNHQAFDVFNWQVQYSFMGQRLNYVGSVSKQDLQSTEPSDKGDVFNSTYAGDAALSNNNGTYTSLASTLNLQNLAQASHSYPKRTNHEIRLSSEERIAGLFDYTVGFFSDYQKPWTDLVTIAAVQVNPTTKAIVLPSAAPLLQVTNRRGRTVERSIFGNLTLHLGEATEISGGLRRIHYETSTNSSSLANPLAATLPADKFNATIWSASVKHRFSDDVMVYASAGSSWRVGSGTNGLILGRSFQGTIIDPYVTQLLATNPETSKSYEIGFRSTWLDKKVTLNVSAFHQDFKDYIFPIAPFLARDYNNAALCPNNTYCTAAATLSTIAAPVPAKVDGIEAELSIRPADYLSLGLNLAYAKAKMTNATIPCAPPVVPTGTAQIAQCTLSQSAGRAAPFSGNFQAEYTRPVMDGMNGFVRTLVTFYGNSTNDAANLLDDYKSYAISNLYAGVRSDNGAWEITAYAKNLFNTLRVLDRSAIAASVRNVNGIPASNYRQISTNDPREFGLSFRYAFGSR